MSAHGVLPGRALGAGQAVALADVPVLAPADLCDAVVDAVAGGARLAAWFGDPRAAGDARVYALLADDPGGALAVLAADAREGYPALTPRCPQALQFERELAEQCALRPEGHPWLKPLRCEPGLVGRDILEGASAGPIPGRHPFFRVEGEGVHEVAVGPVHAGVIEPGHFRFQCHGELVFHLEIQLGYQHRGVERALPGAAPAKRAVLAESIAGDTAVGHALAHAQALEALAGVEAPARAHAIGAVALELERVANHVGDLAALGNDVGFLPTTAFFGRLRGEFLNMLMELSGSRFGRGLVRPGGARFDLDDALRLSFAARLTRARAELAEVADLFFDTTSVLARLDGTGVVSHADCEALGLVGPAARASGSERDVRRDHPTGAYRFHYAPVSRAHGGDVRARCLVRWREAERSLSLLAQLLDALPAGALRRDPGPPRADRLAVAMVEGWRGEIVHAVRTDAAGAVARYKVVDPSFHNWMGLAMALRGEAISDFPLCNKSFNLSYAGHDL